MRDQDEVKVFLSLHELYATQLGLNLDILPLSLLGRLDQAGTEGTPAVREVKRLTCETAARKELTWTWFCQTLCSVQLVKRQEDLDFVLVSHITAVFTDLQMGIQHFYSCLPSSSGQSWTFSLGNCCTRRNICGSSLRPASALASLVLLKGEGLRHRLTCVVMPPVSLSHILAELGVF